MLDWTTDKERALDIATKTAIPFLIFGPSDYRDDIAQNLRSLYLNCISNTSLSAFDGDLKAFEKLIESAPERVTYFQHNDILGYQSRYEDFNHKLKAVLEKQAENESRIKILENQMKILNKIQPEESLKKKGKSNLIAPEPGKIRPFDQILSNRDIVLNALKQSKVPLFSDDISKQTGLTCQQVSAAIKGLRNKYPDQILKESVIREGLYKEGTRNLEFTSYLWKGVSQPEASELPEEEPPEVVQEPPHSEPLEVKDADGLPEGEPEEIAPVLETEENHFNTNLSDNSEKSNESAQIESKARVFYNDLGSIEKMIYCLYNAENPLTNTEIAEQCELSQSTVIAILKDLKDYPETADKIKVSTVSAPRGRPYNYYSWESFNSVNLDRATLRKIKKGLKTFKKLKKKEEKAQFASSQEKPKGVSSKLSEILSENPEEEIEDI